MSEHNAHVERLSRSVAVLNRLFAVERLLPGMLSDPSVEWHGTDVVYHPPRVQRVWCDLAEEHAGWRLNLHRIYACNPKDALMHPHPWPSAMRIVRGRYLHAIGYGTGDDVPPIAAVVVQEQGSVYAMEDQGGWHSVSPIHKVAYTVMISGPPWKRSSPKPGPQPRMQSEDMRELLVVFRAHYQQGR